MTSSSTNSGFATITRHVRHRSRPGPGRRRRAEPRQPALGRMPADVRTNGIIVTKVDDRLHRRPRLLLARTTATPASSSATTSISTSATRSSACPASATSSSSASASSRCGCGSIPTKLAGAQHHRRRRAERAARAERAGRRRRARRCAGAGRAGVHDQRARRWAGCPRSPEFEDVVVKAGKDGALVRVKDVGRVELGAETYSSNLRFLGLEAQGMGISLLPSANAHRGVPGRRSRRWSGSSRTSRRGSSGSSRSTTSSWFASRSSRC